MSAFHPLRTLGGGLGALSFRLTLTVSERIEKMPALPMSRKAGYVTDIHIRLAIPALVSVGGSINPLTNPVIATADAGY